MVQMGKVVLERGTTKYYFLVHNKLYATIHQADWLRAFLPNERDQINKAPICTAAWTSYTNTKDILVNAGQPNKKYPTFGPFTTK